LEKEQETKKLVTDLCAAGLSGKFGEPSNSFNVEIWVRDGFRCVYCQANLLKDRIRMTTAQLDHILPQSSYGSYKDLRDNLILACFCCNSIIKGRFDPLSKVSDEVKRNISPETFKDYRDLLIETCREHMNPLLKKKDQILEKSISIILREHGSV